MVEEMGEPKIVSNMTKAMRAGTSSGLFAFGFHVAMADELHNRQNDGSTSESSFTEELETKWPNANGTNSHQHTQFSSSPSRKRVTSNVLREDEIEGRSFRPDWPWGATAMIHSFPSHST